MTAEEWTYQICQQFAFAPTGEQQRALDTFAQFMCDRSERAAMIMRGCAGTGKTTLSGAIVRTMVALHQRVVLLAPTGRAAKVFSLNSGHPAYTIHRRIYREKAFVGVGGQFMLNDNLFKDALFMVDEASMISNLGLGETAFGSGCLLDDLVRYVYLSGQNNRLLLIGDTAQLPPVGEEESPALNTHTIEGYGLKVYDCDLQEVLRQSQQSGILYNATRIRHLITHEGATTLPRIRLAGFTDIRTVPGSELIDALSESYYRTGTDGTMVVTRSNKRAVAFNQGIRGQVLDREPELSPGDIIMVVKNNYYWTEQERQANPRTTAPAFLANGDRAKVLRVRNKTELFGFHFATLTLQLPDYDDYEITVTALLDTLTSEAASLPREAQEHLFEAVAQDYQDIPQKRERMKAVRGDQYFNALQIKYAYAVTCHKAQGGQWEHVYVDQGYMTDEMLTPDYIHWLYTAFTRATDKLFLVNWPETQTETETQTE